MPLEDVLLTKSYKDGKVLFEKNLDDWRLKAQEGFANVNLNLTQLIRDTFSAGYVFDNDGFANKATSLEDRINAFEQGGADINGTASDTFTINSDGNGATLSTSGLTNTHTYTFPDLDGEFLTTTGIQSVIGAKTFTLQSLKIKGAGAGIITLDYANDTDSRTYTFPDAGANTEVILSAGNQTVSGNKTFAVDALKVAGAGAGVASFSFGNEATSRSFVVPAGADDVFMTRKSAYVAGAGVGLGLIIYANSATSRTLTIPDPGANASFVMTEGTQTINGTKTFTGANVNQGNESFSGNVTFSGQVVLPSSDPPAAANLATRFGPSKLYAQIALTGTIDNNYNVDVPSSGKTGTGTYAIFSDRDFVDGVSLTALASAELSNYNATVVGTFTSSTVKTYRIDTLALSDSSCNLVIFGTQS